MATDRGAGRLAGPRRVVKAGRGRGGCSTESVLVETRAADHLHVGSSWETFADLIGKKAESLPLKLRILNSVNCVAS